MTILRFVCTRSCGYSDTIEPSSCFKHLSPIRDCPKCEGKLLPQAPVKVQDDSYSNTRKAIILEAEEKCNEITIGDLPHHKHNNTNVMNETKQELLKLRQFKAQVMALIKEV